MLPKMILIDFKTKIEKEKVESYANWVKNISLVLASYRTSLPLRSLLIQTCKGFEVGKFNILSYETY